MKTLTLKNDFHNSEVRLTVQDNGGVINLSRGQVKKAWRELCGLKDCQCSGELGIRGQGHTLDGETVKIAADVYTDPMFGNITGAKLFINPEF